jgi:hypothetical protein
MKKRTFALICLLFTIPCQGRTITVDNDGPADFNNIQAAVDDANGGDTIIVADGIYTGPGNRDIVIQDKPSLIVSSQNGPTNCIIDCQATINDGHRAFLLHTTGVLDGFTIKNCIGPEASGGGGGIVCFIPPVIRNCIFRDNYSPNSPGGAIFYRLPFSEVINCTFFNNVSDYSGGAVGIYGVYGQSVVLRNCISWGNSTPDLSVSSCGAKCGTPQIHAEFSILQADWYNSYITLENCVTVDPCFADPCNGDYHLKSQAGRWDPTNQTWVQDDVTSVAIDAGNPMYPIGLEPFPNGGIINMGAYGGTAEASKSYFGGSPCQTIVAGDINGDCIIDFKDFGLMASHWLEDNNL